MSARRIRLSVAALALLSPLALIGANPAAAHGAGTAVVAGSGTISPGLPLTGCTSGQTVKFGGTAVLAGTEHSGVYNVAFSGSSSICESLSAGKGSGTLSGDVSGSVQYTRTENIVTLTGSVTVGGQSHVISAAACEFAPTSVNPTRDYALSCQVAFV